MRRARPFATVVAVVVLLSATVPSAYAFIPVDLTYRWVSGVSFIDAVLTFGDTCLDVLDWGVASRLGTDFSAQVTILDGHGPGIFCAQLVTYPRNTYELGVLSAAHYGFTLALCITLGPSGLPFCFASHFISFTIVDVTIDVKPGSDPNSINVKSQGNIPVAILSHAGFDAPSQVDVASLTFGRTGDEKSLNKCNSSPEDANGDGLLDLVCHFDTQLSGFQAGDTVGTLNGRLLDGTPFTASDAVRAFFPGDVDRNRRVDILDASLLAYAFDTAPGSPLWLPAADFDENLRVDIMDASTLVYYFNQQA